MECIILAICFDSDCYIIEVNPFWGRVHDSAILRQQHRAEHSGGRDNAAVCRIGFKKMHSDPQLYDNCVTRFWRPSSPVRWLTSAKSSFSRPEPTQSMRLASDLIHRRLRPDSESTKPQPLRNPSSSRSSTMYGRPAHTTGRRFGIAGTLPKHADRRPVHRPPSAGYRPVVVTDEGVLSTLLIPHSEGIAAWASSVSRRPGHP